jgi:hypothetical protein
MYWYSKFSMTKFRFSQSCSLIWLTARDCGLWILELFKTKQTETVTVMTKQWQWQSIIQNFFVDVGILCWLCHQLCSQTFLFMYAVCQKIKTTISYFEFAFCILHACGFYGFCQQLFHCLLKYFAIIEGIHRREETMTEMITSTTN